MSGHRSMPRGGKTDLSSSSRVIEQLKLRKSIRFSLFNLIYLHARKKNCSSCHFSVEKGEILIWIFLPQMTAHGLY